MSIPDPGGGLKVLTKYMDTIRPNEKIRTAIIFCLLVIFLPLELWMGYDVLSVQKELTAWWRDGEWKKHCTDFSP